MTPANRLAISRSTPTIALPILSDILHLFASGHDMRYQTVKFDLLQQSFDASMLGDIDMEGRTDWADMRET